MEKMAKVAKRPVLHNLVASPAPGPEDPHAQHEVARAEPTRRACASSGRARPCGPGSPSPWPTGTSTTPAGLERRPPPGTKEEKLRKLADPELRGRLKAEIEEAEAGWPGPMPVGRADPGSLIVQGVNRQANLQSYVGKSVGQIAEEEGKHIIDAMLDLSVAGDLNVEFLGPDKGLQRRANTGELMS